MTSPDMPPVPPMPGQPGAGAGAGAGAIGAAELAGLAREVEALRRTAGSTAGSVAVIEPRVDELARLIEQLAGRVTALAARARPAPAPAWLLAPDDEQQISDLLGELCQWLHAVLLRYADAVAALPACWMRHPDIVEELVWLMHAWLAAYKGDTASVAAAADWHDRYRPGVVRRIHTYARTRGGAPCSLEQHQTRPDWDQYPTGATPTPGVEELVPIAGWWASHRADPAPEPPPALVAPPDAAGDGGWTSWAGSR
jgi:hypothetical protein